MKRLLFILVPLLLVAGAIALVVRWRASGKATEAPVTAVVRRGTINQIVASTGRVVPQREVDIKCRASGQIVKLPFDISQPVKEGDLLLELDPVDARRDVARAKSSVAQSQARVMQAKNDLAVAQKDLITSRLRAQAALGSAAVRAKQTQQKADRRKQLVDEKLGSPEDYETAQIDAAAADAALKTADADVEALAAEALAIGGKEQDVKLAEAQLDADQIQLDIAQQQLDYTRVLAPSDGVISARDVEIGQVVASAITNVSGGTTVMKLADLSKIFVLASVDESGIGKIRVGQRVNVSADSYPGEAFEATVNRVATTGTEVSNVVTFEVKIEVTSANKAKLKPGMTANVDIITATADDALIVPVAAIYLVARDNKVTVQAAPGKTTEETVTTGLTDGDDQQILSGLSQGQTVIVKDETPSRFANNAKKGGPPD